MSGDSRSIELCAACVAALMIVGAMLTVGSASAAREDSQRAMVSRIAELERLVRDHDELLDLQGGAIEELERELRGMNPPAPALTIPPMIVGRSRR